MRGRLQRRRRRRGRIRRRIVRKSVGQGHMRNRKHRVMQMAAIVRVRRNSSDFGDRMKRVGSRAQRRMVHGSSCVHDLVIKRRRRAAIAV